MADKLTDILTYVLALALAVAVLAFAAYKVMALDGMENPPVNMGLNFPAPKRKVIIDGPAADPLTTQSLGRASRNLRTAGDPGPFAYELLTVVDGVAFVAVDSAAEKTLVPATAGTSLPGGLKVSRISRQGGRWTLTAGNLTLTQALAPQ